MTSSLVNRSSCLPPSEVLDLRMQDQSGLVVLRALAIGGHTCPTVLLTAAITDAEVVEAMRLGARGLVLKESQPDALIDCVRRVASGEQWIQTKSHSTANAALISATSAATSAAVASRMPAVSIAMDLRDYRVSFLYLMRCG